MDGKVKRWTEGNLRIRGKRDNIIHFLQENLTPVYELADDEYEDSNILIEENCGGWSLILKKDPDTSDQVFFKGSGYNLYVDFGEGDVEVEFTSKTGSSSDQVACLSGIQTLRNFDYEFLKKVAKTYKVDIRIFIWAREVEWAYSVTYYRNGTFEEMTRKYADWIWDSPLMNYY